MEELLIKYKSEYKDMWDFIMVYKESYRRDADAKRRTTGFEDAARIIVDITADCASLILQEEKVVMKITKINIIS